MLKKSVAKYLYGTKEEILARIGKLHDVKISAVSSPVSTASLKKLGIPHLPTALPSLSVSETIIENLPRARQDVISLMTLSSQDGTYTRAVVLVSAAAPPGRLYGYLGELPLQGTDKGTEK